jgi:hypothetical protein
MTRYANAWSGGASGLPRNMCNSEDWTAPLDLIGIGTHEDLEGAKKPAMTRYSSDALAAGGGAGSKIGVEGWIVPGM